MKLFKKYIKEGRKEKGKYKNRWNKTNSTIVDLKTTTYSHMT